MSEVQLHITPQAIACETCERMGWDDGASGQSPPLGTALTMSVNGAYRVRGAVERTSFRSARSQELERSTYLTASYPQLPN